MITINELIKETGLDDLMFINRMSPEEIEVITNALKVYGEMIVDECAKKAGELAYPGTEKMTEITISISVKEQIK